MSRRARYGVLVAAITADVAPTASLQTCLRQEVPQTAPPLISRDPKADASISVSSTRSPPPTVHLFIFWTILSKINQFNNFWYVKFGTTKFDVKILPTCPPHPSDIATLPREIQKKGHFSTIFILYFRLLTLPQKKQIATVVLQL